MFSKTLSPSVVWTRRWGVFLLTGVPVDGAPTLLAPFMKFWYLGDDRGGVGILLPV